ncbi:FAD-dependent oxidoreductase [Mycetocola sp. 2940]|uniref:FAD-dependent oxidoreductase n=1 Tax=Mycetocola sp. 2940 TaxID=3156452 RepID=UPI003394EA26
MAAVERVVLVGFGSVGARFAEELLPSVLDGRIHLTVIGHEDHEPYNRVLVAEYAVGHTTLDAITLPGTPELTAAGATVHTGVTVLGIDRDQRSLTLDSGETVPYDRLVLATGARANVPTLDGVDRRHRDLMALEKYTHALVGADDVLPDGITVLRSIADAERVRDAVRARQRIVVLGAGVLGLEVALAAAKEGADVCVVHHGGFPMPRNLDRGSGSVLTSALRRLGVSIVAHSRAEAVSFHTDDLAGTRTFDALITADGKKIPGDLLILSCGVTARTDLAVLAGLRTAGGVLVGTDLRSWSDDRVFAIGDCAQVTEPTENLRTQRDVPGAPSGLIGPGWRQAEWLAAHLAAEAAGLPFVSAPPVERPALVMLKADGVDVVAVGDVSVEPWDDDHHPSDGPTHPVSPRRVSSWADPEHGRYVKMVTRDGILTGFVSVGMPRTAAELTLLFERGGELPADRSLLLRFDGPDYADASAADAFAPTATVCWCNGVTVEKIEESAHAGNTTVTCIGKATRAGTGCGGCKGRIGELLTRFAESDGKQELAV